jgi:hypothetical protein
MKILYWKKQKKKKKVAAGLWVPKHIGSKGITSLTVMQSVYQVCAFREFYIAFLQF